MKQGLKERLEAWKVVLEAKGLSQNAKKTKMMIGSENAGKVTFEKNFPCAVCRKGVGSNFILFQFSRYWVPKRCSGKLKEDSRFKC